MIDDDDVTIQVCIYESIKRGWKRRKKMDKHIINDILTILRKGGIKQQLPENDGNDESRNISNLLSIVESWLGVSTGDGSDVGDDNDKDMMEDAAPFDADFYRSLEDFLIKVWNLEETSHHDHP